MTIIDCIGCWHGYYPKLEGGDLLIITGDLTARDTDKQHYDFVVWLEKQDYNRKIVIAGNHDVVLEKDCCLCVADYDGLNIEYLCNFGTEFHGLKIWGIPHSLTFKGINPKCAAFTGEENYIKSKCDLIPDDIDILISHSPPHGILDQNYKGEHCGSKALREAMFRIKPKLLVFSHIHEMGGKQIDLISTICVNCSIMNERYMPVNKPMRIIL